MTNQNEIEQITNCVHFYTVHASHAFLKGEIIDICYVFFPRSKKDTSQQMSLYHDVIHRLGYSQASLSISHHHKQIDVQNSSNYA